eukprot:Sspe_Gene.15309::Locus_5330_Transcript_1_3_Confidence_0.400_Length_4464::g.15309::m.15309/K05048/SLC6A15S; solute carrier family 6 (neurotransmitter transporter, amino acid/orphan) member 15/16/17/18/20
MYTSFPTGRYTQEGTDEAVEQHLDLVNDQVDTCLVTVSEHGVTLEGCAERSGAGWELKLENGDKGSLGADTGVLQWTEGRRKGGIFRLQDSDPPAQHTMKKVHERGRWPEHTFFIATLASVIGFTTLVRLPYQIFRYSGAFLIAYAVALAGVAFPLVVLEMSLGHRFQLAGGVWRQVLPHLRVGAASLVAACAFAVLYVAIMGWGGMMFVASCDDLPWEPDDPRRTVFDAHDTARNCTIPPRIVSTRIVDNVIHNPDGSTTTERGQLETVRSTDTLKTPEYIQRCALCTDSVSYYFYHTALGAMDLWCNPVGQGWSDSSGISGRSLAGMAIAWVWVVAGCAAGPRGVGTVSLVTIPLCAVLLVILIARGATLEGSGGGVVDFFGGFDGSVLTTPDVWLDAVRYSLLSTSVALGVMVASGSRRDPARPFWNTALMVVVVDFAAAVVCGMMIFSYVGHLSSTDRERCFAGLCAEVAQSADHPCRWSSSYDVSPPETFHMCTAVADGIFLRPDCASRCLAPVDRTARYGISFLFTVLPRAMLHASSPNFFTACLFLLIWLVGWHTAVALVHFVSTTLVDDSHRPSAFDSSTAPYGQSPSSPSRLKDMLGTGYAMRMACVAGVAVVGIVCSLLFSADIGLYWLDLFDHYLTNYVVVFTALVEAMGIGWATALAAKDRLIGGRAPRLFLLVWMMGIAVFAALSIGIADDVSPCEPSAWRVEGEDEDGKPATSFCTGYSVGNCTRNPSCRVDRGVCAAFTPRVPSTTSLVADSLIGVVPWADPPTWPQGTLLRETIAGEDVYVAPTELFLVCGAGFTATLRSLRPGVSYAAVDDMAGCISEEAEVCRVSGSLAIAAAVAVALVTAGWGIAFSTSHSRSSPTGFVRHMLWGGVSHQADYIARCEHCADWNGFHMPWGEGSTPSHYAGMCVRAAWCASIKFVVPVVLSVVLGEQLKRDAMSSYGGYAGWMQAWMWALTVLVVVVTLTPSRTSETGLYYTPVCPPRTAPCAVLDEISHYTSRYVSHWGGRLPPPGKFVTPERDRLAISVDGAITKITRQFPVHCTLVATRPHGMWIREEGRGLVEYRVVGDDMMEEVAPLGEKVLWTNVRPINSTFVEDCGEDADDEHTHLVPNSVDPSR